MIFLFICQKALVETLNANTEPGRGYKIEYKTFVFPRDTVTFYSGGLECPQRPMCGPKALVSGGEEVVGSGASHGRCRRHWDHVLEGACAPSIYLTVYFLFIFVFKTWFNVAQAIG